MVGLLKNYKSNYLNYDSRSDTIEKNSQNEIKQNRTVLVDSGHTYNKSPVLSNCFLLEFFFINSAYPH